MEITIIKRTQMSGIVLGFYYRHFQEIMKQKMWKKKEPVKYEE